MEQKNYKYVQSGNVKIDFKQMPNAPWESFMQGCMDFVNEYIEAHGGEEAVRKEMEAK